MSHRKFMTPYGCVEAASEPSPLDIELYGYMNGFDGCSCTKEDHFKHATSMLFNEHTRNFVWHPWADQMLEHACREKYLGLIGSASCGKTDFGSVWGIVNWLADPLNTKVLVTSTSLKESRKRIWGAICDYFCSVPGLPGKLVDSVGTIRTLTGGGHSSDRCGIELIPGEKKKEREAVGKLIGIKARRIFFIADELPELSEALLSAFYSNLAMNPFSQFIGIGNFASMFDPLGVFVKPAAGWGSITPDDCEWKTERGVCLRFDGIKSPNFDHPEDVWPIYGRKQLDEHRKLRENSIEWWRMCRSFPCPANTDSTIYSEADFTRGQNDRAIVWSGPTVRLASLDPGFTNDGDSSVARWGELGEEKDTGRMVLLYRGREVLTTDVTRKDEPRNFQIARAFRKFCEERKIEVENAGVDVSAAGVAFGDIVDEVWSPRYLRIQFGGAASEMHVSDSDPRRGCDAYCNRVTELWFSGLVFLNSRQIAGIDEDAARQLCARRYSTIKGEFLRTIVEGKHDMKKRIGVSPDDADSAMILLDVARQRHGFYAHGIEGRRVGQGDEFAKAIRDTHSLEPSYSEETLDDLPEPVW